MFVGRKTGCHCHDIHLGVKSEHFAQFTSTTLDISLSWLIFISIFTRKTIFFLFVRCSLFSGTAIIVWFLDVIAHTHTTHTWPFHRTFIARGCLSANYNYYYLLSIKVKSPRTIVSITAICRERSMPEFSVTREIIAIVSGHWTRFHDRASIDCH